MGALCGGNSNNNKEETKKNAGTAVTSGSGHGSDNELADNKDNKENKENDMDDDDDDQPTMAQLASKYDIPTLESTRLIGALFASDPKLWPKKEDGTEYSIDDFDSIVRNDEQVKRAISLFEKVPGEDRIRLLKAFFRERYDELTGKTKGDLNKVNVNNFIVSGAIDTAKARDAPKVIDEEKVNAELRPFLMSAGQVAEPVIRENKNQFESKVVTTQLMAGADVSSVGIIEYAQGLLQQAIDENKTAKATGAARAFTDIMDPETKDGVHIPLKQFHNPKCDIDKTVLTSEAASNVDKKLLALIEAGTLVGEVEMAYWPDCYKDNPTLDGTTCLPNRGGYNDLSVIGLSQVGAMGYGNGNPNISANGTNQAIQEVIVSMRTMTVEKENGALSIKHYQIEKESNKIHDYDAFTSKNPDVKLIQNDDIFNDWVTSFGTFGVITHAYITLIPSYVLVESRHEYKVKDWESKFDEFCENDNANLLQLWFSPYVSDKDKDIFVYSEWSNAAKGEMPDTQDYIKKYGGAMRTMTDALLWAGEQAMIAAANLSGEFGVAPAMQLSLKQTVDKVESIKLTCVQALDFGKTNDAKTQTTGVGFNMDNGADFVKTVVNDYIAFLRSKAKDGGNVVTSPFALRFAKKSNGTMSIANSYNVAWIEQPALVGTHHLTDFLDEIWEEFWWKNNEKYQSKMHWGLYFPMTDVLKENAFRNIDSDKVNGFKTRYATFNSGQKFCNQFTKLSGLDDVFES